jgi:hypothetical protein
MKIVFPHSNLLAAVDGVEFKQGQARKNGAPVLVPEHSWEGVLAYVYGSVVKTRIYRMWYQANGVHVAFARSRDGVHWQKPLVRRCAIDNAHPGPTVTLAAGGGVLRADAKTAARSKSNVVFDLHMPSVLYDPQDRERPYKLFGYSDKGYCAAFSRDGIHFTPAVGNPVIPLMKCPAPCGRKTWFSDVAPVFRDTGTRRYVSHVKTYAADREGRVRRCVGYAESANFLEWSKPETIWAPCEEDDRLAQARGFNWADFYGLCGFNYGDGYLGLLWLFFIDHEIAAGTHEGKIEVYLASSADGKKWKRFSDTPLIPLGTAGWDTGMITTANLPVFTGDKILLYYGGSNMSHGAGEPGNPYDESVHRFKVGLSTLRPDGFVYAWSINGRLRTQPMHCDSGLIRVNAHCAQGRVLIDVIHDGRKIKTRELAGGDFLDHRFQTAKTGEIILEITLQNASLYSLEVM